MKHERTCDTRANRARGEAEIVVAGEALRLRPSFAALVAAEDEIGPLFDMVERAAGGCLTLGELVALFWYCLDPKPESLTRERFAEDLTAQGLAALTPNLRILLQQILQGR